MFFLFLGTSDCLLRTVVASITTMMAMSRTVLNAALLVEVVLLKQITVSIALPLTEPFQTAIVMQPTSPPAQTI